MSWHPNSNKHKANHCGYKQKPTKGQVNALIDLYKGEEKPPKKKNTNIQLDLFGGFI